MSLAQKFKLEKYECNLPNWKSIDFLFSVNNEQQLYVEVLTIHFDSNRYENCEKLKNFFDHRLGEKYSIKTEKLSSSLKSVVVIAPIIYGITQEIIKECYSVFKNLPQEENFNTLEPKFFGNIGGKYFNLFSVNDVKSADNTGEL